MCAVGLVVVFWNDVRGNGRVHCVKTWSIVNGRR